MITRDGEIVDTDVTLHLPSVTLDAFADYCAKAGSCRTVNVDAARVRVRQLLEPLKKDDPLLGMTGHTSKLWVAGFRDVCGKGEFMQALLDEGYRLEPQPGGDWALVNAQPKRTWKAFPRVKPLTRASLQAELTTLAVRARTSEDPDVREAANQIGIAVRAAKARRTTESACLLK